MNSEIEQIELSIDEAQKMVNRGLMAERLARNPDFITLVMQGYFVDEAARLVHLSTDPAIPAESQTFIAKDMCGPGAFKRYLSTIVQMGRAQENEIMQAREVLEELRMEEAESDE